MSNTVFDLPEEQFFDDSENIVDEELLAMIQESDTCMPDPANTVLVPSELLNSEDPSGILYGYIRPDSGRHTILAGNGCQPIPQLKADRIGTIGALPDWEWEQCIHGMIQDDGSILFRYLTGDGREVPLEGVPYYPRQDIFSRHLGLLETDWMDDDCALICGCGSVGSCVALQMAHSGVGKFILVDADSLEIHNICRHQCDHVDLGRFKVDAVADRILRINPKAQIRKFYQRIQDVPIHKYADWIDPDHMVVIATCDNRVGDAYASDIARDNDIPFVSVGFMARAWACELFVSLPERNDICYRCAFKNQIDSAQMEMSRNHLYMDADNSQGVNFVPGLDVDIEYGCTLASKLILDIFNRKIPDYQPRMLHKMGQYHIFSGTGDRTGVDEAWCKMLPEPFSSVKLSLSNKCRRCPHCLKPLKKV